LQLLGYGHNPNSTNSLAREIHAEVSSDTNEELIDEEELLKRPQQAESQTQDPMSRSKTEPHLLPHASSSNLVTGIITDDSATGMCSRFSHSA